MPSSVIRHYRYHASERRLEIIFSTGRRYNYYDVLGEVIAGMENAFSKGEFFNTGIRDQFRFSREPEEGSDKPIFRKTL